MVLLFVVCGWREEAVAGVFLRTYLVHSTYVFLCTRATKVGKIVSPAVGPRALSGKKRNMGERGVEICPSVRMSGMLQRGRSLG